MTDAFATDLILAAVCVFIAGFVIVSRDLSALTALVTSAIKVVVPVTYFGFFFDGRWTFLDDVSYVEQAEALTRLHYGPLSALLDSNGRLLFVQLSDGYHILYAWWNLLAQYLFGQHYYSAVFLNVLSTFVSGFALVRVLRILNFPTAYQRGLLIFFLLHWDVLVWSSFVNLKDILVMGLTIAASYFLLAAWSQRRAAPLLSLAAILFCLVWLRYYVPLLLLTAAAFWSLLRSGHRWKILYVVLLLTGTLIVPINWSALQYVQPGGIWLGLIRAPLTPQPWSIDPEYSFLLIPSTLHWISFVPMVIGGILLWMRQHEARFFLIYVVVVLLFYSVVPELQGPRHRVQLTFVVAWMQFHFFWCLAELALRSPRRSPAYLRCRTLPM